MSYRQLAGVGQGSGVPAVRPLPASPAAQRLGNHAPVAAGVGRRLIGRTAAIRAGRFVLHLVEMLVAMEAGMLLYHLLLRGVLAPLGYAAALAPTLDLNRIGMAVFMTVPMVAWMRMRGHGWHDGVEMAVAMLVPMTAVIVLCRLGLDSSLPWLAQASMPAMYLGMLGAMLYRRDHYAGHYAMPHAG